MVSVWLPALYKAREGPVVVVDNEGLVEEGTLEILLLPWRMVMVYGMGRGGSDITDLSYLTYFPPFPTPFFLSLPFPLSTLVLLFIFFELSTRQRSPYCL